MAKELYRVNVNCSYTSTGARALSKSDNRKGVAVTLAPNSNIDDATPTVQKGNSGGTGVDKDIYGVLLYIDEGSDRARVCTDGIVRMKTVASATTADCSKGVVLSPTAAVSPAPSNDGKVDVADPQEGNFKIVAVTGNDILVDLGSNPAVVS